MKILLRSMFCAEPQDNERLFLDNFFIFKNSGLDKELGEHTTDSHVAVWEFITSFVEAHNHVPHYEGMVTFFGNDPEILDHLELLEGVRPITRGDFVLRVKSKIQDRRIQDFKTCLKNTTTIFQEGLEVGKGSEKKLLRGVEDAARYVVNNVQELLTPPLAQRLSGELSADTDSYIKEYLELEENPRAGVGQLTGLMQMDEIVRGAKKKELWTHAGYTSHLKSTFALNWVYNQAFYYNQDCLYYSLEMPYEQVRRNIIAMHTMHEKFNDIRVHLGIQEDPDIPVSLRYRDLQYGELTPVERTFLMDYVIPDIRSGDHGKIHIESDDPDKTGVTVADIRSRSELVHSQSPFHLLVVDHGLLVQPRKWVPSTTERANSVVRDMKRLAMGFNRGEGMAVVLLFQLSREAFKASLKSEGLYKYNLSALSYANECERSSDIVTTTWIDDDLRERGRVLFQALKSRDQEMFKPFFGRIEWPCKRILTCLDQVVMEKLDKGSTASTSISEDDIDALFANM